MPQQVFPQGSVHKEAQVRFLLGTSRVPGLKEQELY